MRRLAGTLGGLGALILSACNTTTTIGGEGQGGTGSGAGTGGGGPLATPDKVDIVLAIDNSRSMADKQQMLSLAVADLIHALENPPCFDPQGNMMAQPISGFDQCPENSNRPYPPVSDIHIGIVSSSLGGHGSDACPVLSASGGSTTNDDRGHLLDRADASGAGQVPTYQDQHFLAWDPAQTMTPPGESDPQALVDALQQMVVGVGQVGCGYESQLESIYRFLVDPNPYDSISVQNLDATLVGTDQVLLQERASFLRPDSALAIIMVTDENDCSIMDGGEYFLAAQQKSGDAAEFHLPKPRAACASDPNDPCCASCGEVAPSGCADPDPACTPGSLSKLEDNINMRCMQQKKRFGIDFLYPTQRYIDGLSAPTITDRDGNSVPNPLLAQRDAGLVFMAGIVGVPWQDVAHDPTDLAQGYKIGAELASVWPVVLGQPDQGVAPTDPLMTESWGPRTGQNPITGEALTTQPNGNGINGNEYSIPGNDDLQYACVWTIPDPRDCADPVKVAAGCDCSMPGNDNPLCTGTDNMTQVRAKAYPALRQLKVLQGLGDQGVVASICAPNVDDPSRADYAYRPAMKALVDRMKPRLAGGP